MKDFLYDITIALMLALTAYLLLPWWGMGLAGVLFALLRYRGTARPTVLAAFLAGFICWGGFAGYLNQMNEGILATRMGALFGGASPSVMVLATAFMGGLTCLLGSWAALTSYDVWKEQVQND